jgi:beta-glucuronidase
MLLNTLPKKQEDEASQYVDFVSTNTYGNHAKALDHIHALYPEKPILISEWGVRADNGADDQPGLRNFSEHDFGQAEVGQAKHVSDIATEIRKRPYVIGASWWTYNDYQSRYHGTNSNGYRPWGIVRPDRSLRPAYYTYQKEMSPLIIEKVGFKTGDQGEHELTLKVTARDDFPSYAIEGYYIPVSGKHVHIPNLNPGESKEITVQVRGFEKAITIQIIKPTGFKTTEATFELK